MLLLTRQNLEKPRKENIMSFFNTLESALKTNKVVVISVETYDHKGSERKWIKVRKSNGKKVYRVAQYSNGLFSEAV